MPLLNESPTPVSRKKMNFNSLPPSLREKIIADVASSPSRRRLPRYATVAREWQMIVERVTFAELYLTDGRLHELGKMMNRRRQSYLQYVMCHVMLGAYADHDNQETNSQHRQSTRVLNDYLTNLFQTMTRWRIEDVCSTGIQLKIVVNSPSDESTSRRWGDPAQSRRARHALAQIDVPSDALPTVSTISGLACSGRHVELASVTLLVTKLPNLRSLDVELEHDTRDSRDVEQRAEFVSNLAIYAPSATNLRLRRPVNHVETHKSPSREQRALFHTRLRNYSQRCQSVTFDDCVFAREFLAPFASDDHQQRQTTVQTSTGAFVTAGIGAPIVKNKDGGSGSGNGNGGSAQDLWWPHLRKLHIRNSYMLRRPYMRVSSRSAALMLIHEVLLLAGRALKHMPNVETVKIKQYVLADGRLETIVLEYHSQGRVGKMLPSVRKGAPRLVIDGLRPSVPTLDAWKASVRETRNSHLVIEIDEMTSHDSSDSMPEDD